MGSWIERAKQLMSKANWTPFIDPRNNVSPYNNVIGRLGGFGAENHQKHDLNDFLTNFGHKWVTVVAHGVIIWGHECKNIMGDTLE
jgi:hypothetical protein